MLTSFTMDSGLGAWQVLLPDSPWQTVAQQSPKRACINFKKLTIPAKYQRIHIPIKIMSANRHKKNRISPSLESWTRRDSTISKTVTKNIIELILFRSLYVFYLIFYNKLTYWFIEGSQFRSRLLLLYCHPLTESMRNCLFVNAK